MTHKSGVAALSNVAFESNRCGGESSGGLSFEDNRSSGQIFSLPHPIALLGDADFSSPFAISSASASEAATSIGYPQNFSDMIWKALMPIRFAREGST